MAGYIILGILLLLILLVFFVPYGIDAAYGDGAYYLNIQAGPFRIRFLPKKPLTEKQKAKKEKKGAAKKSKEKPKPEEEAPKPKKKTGGAGGGAKALLGELNVETVLELLEIAIHAIRRLFRSFTVNYFKLRFTAASNDPYTTAKEYASVCAAVTALPAMCGDVIRVRRRDIEIGADYLAETPEFSVRITLTLRLFLIVHMAVAFLVEFIIYKIKHRGDSAAASTERKDDNGRQKAQ